MKLNFDSIELDRGTFPAFWKVAGKTLYITSACGSVFAKTKIERLNNMQFRKAEIDWT